MQSQSATGAVAQSAGGPPPYEDPPPYTAQTNGDDDSAGQAGILLNIAGPKVFNTTELLELVLLHLPLQNVLQGQVVNKQWRATVLGSARLQQALFFKPIRPLSEDECPSGHLVIHSTGSVELTRPPQYARYPWHLRTANDVYKAAKLDEEPLTNPLLTRVFPRRPDIIVDGRAAAVFNFGPIYAGSALAGDVISWTRMYVTQPPITRMMATLHARLGRIDTRFADPAAVGRDFYGPAEPRRLHLQQLGGIIENERGITIEDLVEFGERECQWGARDGRDRWFFDFTWVT